MKQTPCEFEPRELSLEDTFLCLPDVGNTALLAYLTTTILGLLAHLSSRERFITHIVTYAIFMGGGAAKPLRDVGHEVSILNDVSLRGLRLIIICGASVSSCSWPANGRGG